MTTGELIVPPQQQVATRQVYQVNDPIAVLDTARFEQMQRIASIMARSNLIPESLSSVREGRTVTPLPFEAVMANCFLVVNQAVRWGMDPFAVAQSVSVIKGKICYEGKLIAAVLDAKLGIRLVPEFEERNGAAVAVTIYAYDRDGNLIANPRTGDALTVQGALADWRTTGDGSPWSNASGHRRMFTYRGAREWTRMHRPALMLGVYTDDEMADLVEETPRSTTARTETRVAPVPPQARIAATPDASATANAEEQAPKPTTALSESVAPGSGPTPPAEQRQPPIPPGAKPRQAQPKAGSFGAVLEAWQVHSGQAADVEQLGAVWDEHVEPHFDKLAPHEQDQMLHLSRSRHAELGGQEGAEP